MIFNVTTEQAREVVDTGILRIVDNAYAVYAVDVKQDGDIADVVYYFFLGNAAGVPLGFYALSLHIIAAGDCEDWFYWGTPKQPQLVYVDDAVAKAAAHKSFGNYTVDKFGNPVGLLRHGSVPSTEKPNVGFIGDLKPYKVKSLVFMGSFIEGVFMAFSEAELLKHLRETYGHNEYDVDIVSIKKTLSLRIIICALSHVYLG